MTTTTDHAPLIPRAHIFGNPSRASGLISPDGSWLSWLAPSDGVLNVWMSPVADPTAGKVMTRATDRPIREYLWAPDSRSLLYFQDEGGDENFLLYGVDVETGDERNLTPFANTRVQVVGGSETIRDRILIGINNRDPRFHDVHLLDLNTGDISLVMQNDGFAGFMADDRLQLRLAIRPNEAGGVDFFSIVDGQIDAVATTSTTLDDSLTTSPAGFTTDGATLYWLDSRGRDTAALFADDVASGERRLIAESDQADIGDTLRNPATGEVDAYAVDYLTKEWTALDPDIAAALDWLGERLTGDFGVQSRTSDDRMWIIWNDPLTTPSATYIFNRDAETLEPFYTTRPELAGAPLQPMHPIEITARDGLVLPSYLTLSLIHI